MNNPPTAVDFDGCNRKCRLAGAHTLAWGECEHAPKPEPTVSLSRVYTASDGFPAIGFDTYTVPALAELIEGGLRTAPFHELRADDYVNGPLLIKGHLKDLARSAAHAIVHRNAAPAAADTAVPPTGQTDEPDDTDLSEADVDRMMAAGVPVQIVTAPPDTHGAVSVCKFEQGCHRVVACEPGCASPAGLVAVPPTTTNRAAVSAKLWAIAEHHIVAEWICCEPLDPKHDLCAQGYAALGMARTLLVDSDPEEAWNPAAPVLDAVMAMLPPPADRIAAPTVWIDGHPQLEAIAAAVWERCRTEDTSTVVDDPRNIAVAAYAAVMAMLRAGSEDTTTTRADALREGADVLWNHPRATAVDSDFRAAADELRRLAAETQPSRPSCPDPIECGHEAALGEALARVERLALTFQVSGNEFIAEQIRAAVGARQELGTERPRCPHCQLPHDLTPGSMPVRARASILASLAEAAHLHDEGDHSRCAAVDCDVVRARRAAAASAGVQTDEETRNG